MILRLSARVRYPCEIRRWPDYSAHSFPHLLRPAYAAQLQESRFATPGTEIEEHLSRLLRFNDFQKLVRTNVIQSLAHARWPRDFDFRRGGLAESEVQSLVACGKIAACTGCKSSLPIYAYTRSKPV